MAKFITETVNLNDFINDEKPKNRKNDFFEKLKKQAEINEKMRKGLPIEPDSPFVREYFVTDYNPNMLQFEKDRLERRKLFMEWREEKGWDSDPTPYRLEQFSERIPDEEREREFLEKVRYEKIVLNNYAPEVNNEVIYSTEETSENSTMAEAFSSAMNTEKENKPRVAKIKIKPNFNKKTKSQMRKEKAEREKENKYRYDLTSTEPESDKENSTLPTVTKGKPNKNEVSSTEPTSDKVNLVPESDKVNSEPVVDKVKPKNGDKKYRFDLTEPNSDEVNYVPVVDKVKPKNDDKKYRFDLTSTEPESDKENSTLPTVTKGKPKNQIHIESKNTNKKYKFDLTNDEEPTSDKVNLVPESDKVNSEPVVDKVKPEKNVIRNKDYIDKDMSLVLFNTRLLNQAMDKSIPLFERLNFLSIADSNMDEFCRVRFAKKYKQFCKEPNTKCIDGNTVAHVYKAIKKSINKFINLEDKVYNELMVEMNKNNFQLITDIDKLSKYEKKKLREYYDDYVGPILTPLVFDNTRPFPMLKNDVKYLGLIIRNEELQENLFGAVEIPNQLNRFVEIKSGDNTRKFILLEDIIYANIDDLYTGRKIVKNCVFRVLKKYDYTVSDTGFISNEVEHNIDYLYDDDNIMRLDITETCGKTLYNILTQIIGKPEIINKKKDIIDYKVLSNFMNIRLTKEESEKFKYKKIVPAESKDDSVNIFDRIDNDDILLQHPYESYNTVVNFINTAADDPNVLGIKQTLYRVSSKSPIVSALLKALKNGKQVTVVAEVKARFDELNNIKWAKKLSDAGGQIIYGTNNLKVHGKMCLVTRVNKKGKIKQYLHVGTGNYNEKTSTVYTDISYLTCDKSMLKDANKIFNSISGSNEVKLNKLIASPNGIHDNIMKFIDKEIEAAKNGKEANITMKMNGLTEKSVINKLYEAADNGVDITLIVRGACSLFNTSKIKVKSIIGQFLEHSRIYRFKNSGIFISSADMMERNLFRRIELLVPIKGDCEDKINDILNIYMNDKSAYELIDGEYKRVFPIGETEIRKVKVKTNKLNKELSTFESVGDIYGSQEYFFKCNIAHNKNTKITNMSKIYQKTKKGEKKRLINNDDNVEDAQQESKNKVNNNEQKHSNRLIL